MLKKIMNILFDEEEIIVEEDVAQEETYDIPSIKPLTERKETPIVNELGGVVEQEKTPSVNKSVEKQVVAERQVTPVSDHEGLGITLDKPRSRMIDVDEPKVKTAPEKELYFPKKDTSTPYQPIDIISPIYGGPKRDETARPVAPVVQTKKRTPMTQVISPMYGQVESKSTLGDIEPEILELDVADMHSGQDLGVEIQASLYDMIEGLEDEE